MRWRFQINHHNLLSRNCIWVFVTQHDMTRLTKSSAPSTARDKSIARYRRSFKPICLSKIASQIAASEKDWVDILADYESKDRHTRTMFSKLRTALVTERFGSE